jgi:hypothetical protein
MALQRLQEAILSAETVPLTDDRSKRDTMSIDKSTVSNMWEIAAIVEVLERKGLCVDCFPCSRGRLHQT